ncbi:CinA family protein [Chitinophaga pinensis]|uniref:CinA domain protein n=1 Tax=Chitinophaga pinensis (strain ATCC 43595 / DSM 2588 / LMG 13176 / NBRC 15968 / NCIMB 11800 / UQM 2034) TaxID=485918 RepID=A0A979GRJ7_CHIPD|nr:nicotinamide-nucleotide amidohydrolase family protein [Chitinophaga pinensis]ACU62482.1 CinA domain protein [Chitinophaga pinensis DSM 2588]
MIESGYDIDIINNISTILQQREETLAIAESVTAGQLQVAFSLADGATQILQGGITAYNIGQKARHLKVDPVHAGNTNCVSQKVADQMAAEVLQLFAADWGIAITGYASPVPEENIFELFAHYAIYHRQNCIKCGRITAPVGEVLGVRTHFANTVLQKFREACSQIHI